MAQTEKAREISPGSALLAALEGRRIQPIRAGLFYRIGLLLVAVTMLLLPLVYLALMAGVGLAIYWHLVNNLDVFHDLGVRAASIVYVGPLLIGVILLLFMLKPFFSKRGRDASIPVTLRAEDETLLFQFIYRLCAAVRAPPPRRVDVTMDMNASASFMGGWRGVLGQRLVLTFGLPLASGLNAREFAGVLAHEMGHFSQGSAMRLTYLIRSINAWFARLVYQRDVWDEQLAAASRGGSHYLIQLVAIIARAMIWITRRILWCLMWIGHGVSSLMLRQMEFNADRYEYRIVGTDAFIRTSQRLACLSVATSVAFRDLHLAWREQRLCDDLPALIESRDIEMPDEVREQILKQNSQVRSGWFDSHPSDADRIAAARRENAPGHFELDPPAKLLFRDFAELSRVATLVFYKQRIGPAFDRKHVVQTGALVEGRAEQRKNQASLDRYFRGLISSMRPIFPRLASGAMDPAAQAERLLELRSRLVEGEADARAAAREFDSACGRVAVLTATRNLRTAGVRKSGASDPAIDAMSDDELSRNADAEKARSSAARDRIDRTLRVAMERLALSLTLERGTPAEPQSPPPPEGEDLPDMGEYNLAEPPESESGDAELAALAAMSAAAANADALRPHSLTLRLLLSRLRPQSSDKPLIQTILWHSRKASALLREMAQDLGRVQYPYADEGRSISLVNCIVRSMPTPEQVGEVASSMHDALDAYDTLYERLMASLAARAEKIELALGLPPLEEPKSDPAV